MNTMNECLTNQDLIEYMTPRKMTLERLQFLARVHAHMGSCEACRALITDAARFQELTENRNAHASANRFESSAADFEYEAVASDSIDDELDEPDFLSIRVSAGTGAQFLRNSLVQSGDAGKYEFQFSENDALLADAFDENCMLKIRDGAIEIALPDNPERICFAKLYLADRVVAEAVLNTEGRATLKLPDSGVYLLVITLG